MCKMDEETNTQLFIHKLCLRFSAEELDLFICHLPWVIPQTVGHLMRQWFLPPFAKKGIWRSVVAITLWNIWLGRNNRTFQKKVGELSLMQIKILNHLFHWMQSTAEFASIPELTLILGFIYWPISRAGQSVTNMHGSCH
ncbi:hypothetical protein AMTRI_Chr11g97180 [Amborella trichopoda]